MSMITSLFTIDDDPIHHKLVEYLLQPYSQIKHQIFLHAADALADIINKNEFETLPDLILLDLGMPYISGWGFLDLFEAMGPNLAKPIDVIILTSSANYGDREKASTYKCVKGFVCKPLTPDLMEDILNSSFISVNRVSKYFT